MNFYQKSAVIVYHDSVFGPPHELRNFLLKHKISNLLCIGHVNRYIPNNPIKKSYYEVYHNGKRLCRKQAGLSINSEFIQYIFDSILTLFLTLKFCNNQVDYFIGLGNLNVFIGILLQKFKKVSKTVYYVIDYVPQRFSNNYINYFYHYLDAVCAEKSTITWNYSQSMIEARNKKHKKKFPHQIVVSNGIHIRRNLILPFNKINLNKFVYIGSLTENQGVQLIIQALKILILKNNKFILNIIGNGPYRSDLDELISKLKLNKYIKLWGRVEDPIEADKIIADAVLGFALYKPENQLVYTTEPGKVKRYLALGVPVFMTDTGLITQEIQQNKCGFSVKYNARYVASSVWNFLQNKAEIQQYRQNAIQYASKYIWDDIFSKAFSFTITS
jgi:glycosyltransferase involved in cell wall biosynthesis